MAVLTALLGPIAGIVDKVLDRAIPDPEQREQAKRELLRLQQDGEIDRIEAQLSAIVTEAKSNDPWTSRARPTFMYVVYALFLFAIPFGVFYTFDPIKAMGITAGMKSWFNAIPQEMYYLFGVGYLGYTGARSFEKTKLFKPKP